MGDSLPNPTDNLTFYPGILSCNSTFLDNPQFPGYTKCGINFNNDGNISNDNALVEAEYNDMINNYGIIVDYYVHNYDKKNSADNMTGTDLTKKYNYPVPLKMYVKYNAGAVSLMKFGYMSADEVEAIILIKTFTETMSSLSAYSVYQQPCAPKAGDIIKLTNFGKSRPIGMDGKMFICTERLDEDPEINTLGGHYIWHMRFKRFQFDYEGVENNPDGTPNILAEKRNDQISDNDIFGRLLSGENFATDNGTISASTMEELSAMKQYPYDASQVSNDLYPEIFGVNNTLIYGYGGDASRYASIKWYATTINIAEATLQPTSLNTDIQEIDLIAEDGVYKQTIQMPKEYIMTGVQLLNPSDSTWYWVFGSKTQSVNSFTYSNILKTIDGEEIEYNQYIYNGPRVGDRRIKFYIERNG